MCGIVGVLSFNSKSLDPNAVMRAANTLAKRGPDDWGVWTEDNVGLGHRRLSVLDLTITGHQPMLSMDGRFVIVFNGEIYNYRDIRSATDNDNWFGNSDTEVIIAAYRKWGPDCVHRFHGMFAFAIWDRKERTLFAARDRLGVKPLYYHHSSDYFAFASRPKALFPLARISRGLDLQALRFFLEMGYIPGPYSIYNEIKKVPPGHYLVLNENSLNIRRYWDFRHIAPEPSWSNRREEDLLEELETLVSRCVRSRMISDVPLGAFLSGGIDSSLVVSMMAKFSSAPVKAFTIGFKEAVFDESPHAKAVAEHLGVEHYVEYLSINDLLTLLPTFLEEFDEPFFDSSAFPVMAVSRMARRHVTVSLSGDGGDELFGGYHYYQIMQKMRYFFRVPGRIRFALANLLRTIPGHRLKLLSAALRQPDILSAFVFSRSVAKDYQPILQPSVLQETVGSTEYLLTKLGALHSRVEPVDKAMAFDTFYTLPDDYLQKVDVGSMTFSLEARDPLLDQDIVEWAFKLPLCWKLRNGQNKYLLRKLAYKHVSRDILERRKQGFEIPIAHWLRGPLRTWAEERLYEKRIIEDIGLNQNAIIQLWEAHSSGRRQAHPLLWAVLMLIGFYETSEKSLFSSFE